MKRTFACSIAIAFAAALFFCPRFAIAQSAGYDLLQTGTDASIDLGTTIKGIAPATIQLEGVPICPCTGASDTIMHRGDKRPDGTADLTVVALFMKNRERVVFERTPVDVYVTVNNSSGMIGLNTVPQPDSLTPSTGTLNIHTDGTFDSNFTVNADVIVVPAGADPRNPATHALAHHAAPPVHLGAHGSPWSATPPPGYPECFFPGNGFYPAGPVPETDPTNPAHRHPVTPSSPVTVTLVAIPPAFSGHCPGHIHFSGTITAPPGVHGTYTFQRSDGGSDPVYPFGPGSTPVTYDWELTGTGGWVAVKILTPGVLESSHATFTMHCTP
jgi:hypothetical protein